MNIFAVLHEHAAKPRVFLYFSLYSRSFISPLVSFYYQQFYRNEQNFIYPYFSFGNSTTYFILYRDKNSITTNFFADEQRKKERGAFRCVFDQSRSVIPSVVVGTARRAKVNYKREEAKIRSREKLKRGSFSASLVRRKAPFLLLLLLLRARSFSLSLFVYVISAPHFDAVEKRTASSVPEPLASQRARLLYFIFIKYNYASSFFLQTR